MHVELLDTRLISTRASHTGLNKKEAAESLPEFEREMRRRVWCVIDCWDW